MDHVKSLIATCNWSWLKTGVKKNPYN